MATLPAPGSKRLFVFCDGTTQDGLISWEVAEDLVKALGSDPELSKLKDDLKSSTRKYGKPDGMINYPIGTLRSKGSCRALPPAPPRPRSTPRCKPNGANTAYPEGH
ncbi:hypothetical protein FRC08_014615 [Ceratobasidium sp. 394]|nr:hypothetical protein FRC08_014615 [Ceratobasidium sp. 394]